MKEIEEDTNKWKNMPCSWIERILLKYAYYPSDLQFQCNPYQNPNDILYRSRKNKPRIHLEPLKALYAQSSFTQQDQS